MTNVPTSVPETTCVFKPYKPNIKMQIRLVNTVTSEMKNFFDIHTLEPFKIIFEITHSSPETFKQTRQIYIPALDVYWCQIIYQYAHEFCHLLIPEPIPLNFKWFEESICDLASLFFLQVLSEKWITFFPEYTNFQNHIAKYITDLSTGTPFPLELLSDTNTDIYLYLSNEPYNRAMNRFFALQIFPVFKSHHSLWKAVPQLCDGADSSSFLEYLQSWKQNTIQDCINKIISKIHPQQTQEYNNYH